MSREEILGAFYGMNIYARHKKGWKTPFEADQWKGVTLTADLIDADTGKVVAEAETKITPRTIKKLQEGGLKSIIVSSEGLVGRYLAVDIIDEQGIVLYEAGDELTAASVQELADAEVKDIKLLAIDHVNIGA